MDLILKSGQSVTYSIVESLKAKNVRLKLSAINGFTVIVPKNYDKKKISEILLAKENWIQSHFNRFEEIKQFFHESPMSILPEMIDLPAIGENWRIE
jgi:predicted metal-dependent hydrolase